MSMKLPSSFLLLFFLPALCVNAQDMYCGEQNCYDVLGMSRESSKSDISKAYRKLAGKWHPDRFRTTEDKEVAEKNFMVIAGAYEVLKDEESRAEYDYMLDHPEEMWQNYYRYYRRRMAPKVDVRIVIAVTITIISFIQYYSALYKYEEAISYLVQVPKYRIQAARIAESEGIIIKKRIEKGKSKEEMRKEEEQIIRKIIESKMSIHGGYSKPNYTDILWVQLIILPVTIYQWIYFYVRWFWKFTIKGEDYGEEEKLYIIRKNMKLSLGQFESLEEEERQDYLEEELWVKENFTIWKQAKDDEMRIKMAQSGRYKQYRRYMKNHGPDRMTFDDS
ncbi:dnaJ homolog subfamily C member 25 homolog [Lepeophtheirus salmonis]|uniref:DnaJ homolog dnj-2 n=1 Tax=Lepeophtheirus salmonis TaxID=72036 RepID=C1BSF1_LEPSM|nr:dnaJ homolog subfamily C member 25 homolog [Lepeophtheirus salmonis]XP_040580233.1 dnaJ homolog subfamily C member 25 homolog [Lepeophtheirus salmonis]XP_040580234.1 dnaJ homolog subfamily C member 25 homolog [Lepeophtheirus salmonis]ACO11954.1 DnaJ homolog dnj-2 precursor [Lepeophtheirus salmonis]